MHLEMSVSKIKANFTEMTSNTIYIVAFGVGFKCPRKIYLNTECVGERMPSRFRRLWFDERDVECGTKKFCAKIC